MTLHQQIRRFSLFVTASALVAGTALMAAPAQAAEPDITIGDCLMVDDAWSGTSDFAVVDCAETHNGEVYDVVAYPSDAGAPSTLTDEEIGRLTDECSWDAFDTWLGAEVNLPLRIWRWYVSVPSDEAWQAGSRDVACRSLRPTASDSALVYTGALPEIFASTPLQQWVTCAAKTPKSGAPNKTGNCSTKSGWLLLGGAQVKGKVTAKYPKDLQPAADKACGSLVKKFGKKGTKAVAALLPKEWVDPSTIFTECFIPLASWNGKGR